MAANRKFVFTNDGIYHVFNRGIERRNVFSTISDYRRFFQLLSYCRNDGLSCRFSHIPREMKKGHTCPRTTKEVQPCLVEILAWCLLPNHYHLVLRQKRFNGITKYMARVSNSYTRYYNTRNKRIGNLFQGPFKAVIVETDDQLIHLSRYIHLNPVVASLIPINKLATYHWSSYLEYLDLIQGFTEKQSVLGYFPSEFAYRVFVNNQDEFAAEVEKVRHLTLEA